MSWYAIFYWITVADSIKNFFDVISNIATWFFVIAFIVYIILIFCRLAEESENGKDDPDYKALNSACSVFRRVVTASLFIGLFTWMGYIFTPTKRDALLVVAGGAVGNFITKDTSARQVPGEVMTLLRDKIRSEIKDIHLHDITTQAVADTLQSKTKEELIELIKKK